MEITVKKSSIKLKKVLNETKIEKKIIEDKKNETEAVIIKSTPEKIEEGN